MSLLPSRLTLMSWLYVFVSWSGIARAGNGPCSNTPDRLLANAKSLVTVQDLSGAEIVLKNGSICFDENRDIAFQYVRVLAWNGKIAEAKKRFKTWANRDAESQELAGDLAWFEGNHVEASRQYLAAENSVGGKASVGLRSKRLRVSYSLGKREVAKQEMQALIASAPSDPDVMAARFWIENAENEATDSQETLKTNQPRIQVALEGTEVWQSQEGHEAIRVAKAVGKWSNFSLGTSFAASAKTGIDYRLVSDVVAVQLTREWRPRLVTSVGYGHAFRAEYGYKSRISADQSLPISRFGYGGLGLWQSRYVGETVLTFVPFVGITQGGSTFEARAYYSTGTITGRSGQTLFRRTMDTLVWELLLAGGVEESARPYLIGRRMSSFQAFASRVELPIGDYFMGGLGFERRWEEEYKHDGVTVVGRLTL